MVEIAAYTGFPEMMDGRLKTLHPKVFGGILGRLDQPDDLASMAEHQIRTFELVVVNLYPFQATIAREDTTFEQALEQIDIGGPSLVRAAAKNHAFVTVATDPAQYAELLRQIKASGATSHALRRELAAAAFAHTAAYDQAIAAYFARQTRPDGLPPMIGLTLQRKAALRYRREPTPAGSPVRITGRRPDHIGGRRATARQGAFVQQLSGSGRGADAGPRDDRPGRRGHQTQQPLRRRHGPDLWTRPRKRHWTETRSVPSARCWDSIAR